MALRAQDVLTSVYQKEHLLGKLCEINWSVYIKPNLISILVKDKFQRTKLKMTTHKNAKTLRTHLMTVLFY